MFGVTLARLSAMIPHTMRFDSGISKGSLNMFVALIGASAAGKSTGKSVSMDLLRRPRYLDGDLFRDGLPLGSGEGLAEAFYGTVTENQINEITGKPKVVRVRQQVRHNVFVYVDEGETLTKTIERAGATIGPAIRSAWNGELIGQSNAREETTRILPQGSYSLGMVMGFQRSTAQPLLADAGPGTPQRFLWLSATDPSIPDTRMNWPGELTVNLDGREWLSGDVDAIPNVVIDFADPIKDELWHRNRAYARGDVEPPELDAHEPLMRCKVASLLAVLDGRFYVTEEDWDLSLMVWDTSRAVRDDLIRWGQDQQRQREEARNLAAAVREAAIRDHVRDSHAANVERVAALLTSYLKREDMQTPGNLRRRLSGRDRDIFPEALEYAISMDAIKYANPSKSKCRYVSD
ncbi:hypothetical protein OG994_16670 [Micromonospora globbae]|uniref:DUF3987 domain-containing protein n=1 Tax=Micromonospora globbae TaxID=1894969 RepID=A0ABZ1S044_9ACTN|nr:hypothetical protein [Micromonospora globbae]